MTNVVPATGGNVPATLPEYRGMDDLAPSDMSMPRLSIGHALDAGKFIDSLDGGKYPTIDVIILGMVKQRILWPAEMEEGKSQPLCRSLDFDTGRPDPGEEGRASRFPWKQSGFDPTTILSTGGTLPCTACPLKEWDSHPTRSTTWCTEQVVLTVLLAPNFTPAILSTQRSSLKPTKAYLTSFFRDKLPPFSVVSHLSLDVQTRGNVTFSVPKFAKGDPTDQDKWGEYITTFNNMEDFLKRPFVRDGEANEAIDASSAPSPTAPAQPAAAAPTVSSQTGQNQPEAANVTTPDTAASTEDPADLPF